MTLWLTKTRCCWSSTLRGKDPRPHPTSLDEGVPLCSHEFAPQSSRPCGGAGWEQEHRGVKQERVLWWLRQGRGPVMTWRPVWVTDPFLAAGSALTRLQAAPPPSPATRGLREGAPSPAGSGHPARAVPHPVCPSLSPPLLISESLLVCPLSPALLGSLLRRDS